MPDTETLIAGLLRELVAYEALEDEANIVGVKNELARLGWKDKAAAPAKRAEKRPAAQKEER